jgi:hypothetical protein
MNVASRAQLCYITCRKAVEFVQVWPEDVRDEEKTGKGRTPKRKANGDELPCAWRLDSQRSGREIPKISL